MVDVKAFMERQLGFTDLLNWDSLIDDGTVLTKDGSLLSGWFYRGEDMGAASPQARNYQTQIVNDALARLGSGWAIWFESVRVPAPSYPARERSHFPDPITFSIDEERRQQFTQEGAHFITIQVMIIQYKPPRTSSSRLNDFFYHDQARQEDLSARHLEYFNHMLEKIEGALGSVLTTHRMRSYKARDPHGVEHFRDELIDFLAFCLNGQSRPINIPPQGALTDSYICSDEFYSGMTPKIGEKFIYCVAIEGFPAQSYPGLLDILEALPIDYRFSSRFIFIDPHQAKRQIQALRRSWHQKARGFFSQIFKTASKQYNEDALDMARQAQDADAKAESGLVTFGYYTPVIVLMDEDRNKAEEAGKKIVNELRRFGLGGRIESVNATAAYFGSLPGHTLANVRRPFFHTQTFADLLPLASLWTGRQHNPCDFYPTQSPPLFLSATTGATPFCFNWHVGQLGHGLIFGPTRSGKSTFLAFCVAQFMRYENAKITAFDKGNSLRVLTHAIGEDGGAYHYDIGADSSSLAFAPLSELQTPSQQSWAISWISQCYKLHLNKLPSPEETHEIEKAITQLSHAPLQARSITDFCAAVQSKTVRIVMNYYAIGNPGGALLDGREDNMANAPLKVFELEELLRLDRRIFLPTMHYLVRRFITSLDGHPAMLIIDEAWTFFKDETMRHHLEEWLRVLAKANCIVILATQSLYDALQSDLLPLLVESCPTKIFLPNPEASHPHIASIYQQFGLCDREIEIIAKAQRQQHYYVSSFDGKRIIDLGLGPLARTFLAKTSRHDLKKTADLKAQHGALWPVIWSKQHDVDHTLVQSTQLFETHHDQPH